MDPFVKTLVKRTAWTALAILLLCALLTGWHAVPPGHRGIATTLGAVHPVPLPEGFTWKRPFGLRKIVDVPVQQITQAGVAECYSSDLQQMTVRYSVFYRIPDNRVVELYQQYAGNPYQSLVEPRLQDSLKRSAALHRAEDAVKKRDVIRDDVLQALRTSVGDIIGIRDLAIVNIDLSNDLEAAIENKQVQEQQALAKTYELQKAQKDAEIAVVAATAEAKSVQIRGDALKSAPAVIELEIAKKWNGVAPLYVNTTAGGANVVLPLK